MTLQDDGINVVVTRGTIKERVRSESTGSLHSPMLS